MQHSPTRQFPRNLMSSTPLYVEPTSPQKSLSAIPPPTATLRVPPQQINQTVQVLGWRYKTSLPIVKPVYYRLLRSASFEEQILLKSNAQGKDKSAFEGAQWIESSESMMQYVNAHQQVQFWQIAVRTEEFRCRLNEIDLLPCSQILYLLKQMMIGFEVLFDIFGTFEPDDSMIMVDRGDKWKMWINSDYTINTKKDLNKEISQRQFLYKLISIAEKHAMQNVNSKKLFTQLKAFTNQQRCNFIKIIERIKQFGQAQKILQVSKVIIPIKKDKEKFQNPIQLPVKPNMINNNRVTIDVIHNRTSIDNGFPMRRTPIQKVGMFKYGNINNKSAKDLFPAPVVKGFTSPTSKIIQNNAFPQRNQPLGFSNLQFRKPAPINTKVASNIFQSNPSYMQSSTQQFDRYKNQTMNDNFATCMTPQAKKAGPAFKSVMSPPPRMEVPCFSPSPKLARFPGSSLSNIHSFQAQNQQKQPQIVKKNYAPVQPQPAHKPNYVQVSHQPVSAQPNYVMKNMKQTTMMRAPAKKPKARKYSEQLFKVKSFDLLQTKKNVQGDSNIYENDPETKKIIKNQMPSNNITSLQRIQSPQKTKYDLQCMSSPNNSSSTHEVRNSQQNNKKKAHQNYQNLKKNDLNTEKGRNNISSCYGMGSVKPDSNRNMTTSSYQFTNQKQSNSSGQGFTGGSNWANKISGLFSDNASIKQLKASVKIKTKQEQRFQKQYLKDVKLDLLQKFGRQVRYSIADQDEDLYNPRQSGKDNYKSMQLIEEVMDQGKSYLSPQENRQYEDCSNSQQQIKSQEVYSDKAKARDCVSEYQQSEGSELQTGFNFQTEMYIINPKR